MIKIVSAYSYPTGPVTALVELCSLFNANACECNFYGPDKWHLDKCRAAPLVDFQPQNGDIVIMHGFALSSLADLNKLSELVAPIKQKGGVQRLMGLMTCFTGSSHKPDNFRLISTFQGYNGRPNSRSAIAHCHKAHYVSTEQQVIDRFQTDSFVCLNPVGRLKPSSEKLDRVAGVIGSIKQDNKTASSIEKALQDGMEHVIIYGYLLEPIYYYKEIEPLTRKYPGKIQFAGFVENRQKVFDSVSDVYCSVNKPWSMVRQECVLTNTPYHGPEVFTPPEPMTNEQIFQVWKKELGL